jgi:two-component system, LytTR family, sensor kinase
MYRGEYNYTFDESARSLDQGAKRVLSHSSCHDYNSCMNMPPLSPPAPVRRNTTWWQRFPLFWRCQIGGWLLFAFIITLFKAAVLRDIETAAISTLLHESIGFTLTWVLHRVMQRWGVPPPGLELLLRVMLGCAVLTAIDVTLFEILRSQFFDSHQLLLPDERGVLLVAFYRYLIYACWCGLYFGIKALRAHVETAKAASTAEMQALRAQLNPHFLFNALNSIAAEADDNPRAVKAISQELAQYLRYSLAHRHVREVRLADEVDALMHYLRVERARFEEHLTVHLDISDEARSALVPGFLLQPLVENAVKHGLASRPTGIVVNVRASCLPDALILEVSNTGTWRTPTTDGAHTGFGLESIKRRLALMYPRQHQINIERGAEWVSVTMQIPHRQVV